MNDIEYEIYTNIMLDILKQIDKHAFILEGNVRKADFGSAKEVNISQRFDCVCCEITIPEKENYVWVGPDMDRFIIRIIVHEYIHIIKFDGDENMYNFLDLTDPKSISKSISIINKCLKSIKLIKTF